MATIENQLKAYIYLKDLQTYDLQTYEQQKRSKQKLSSYLLKFLSHQKLQKYSVSTTKSWALI